MRDEPGARLLEGLKVVDCSFGMAGPRAGGVLADYGADVTWVVPPGGCPLADDLRIPYSVFNRAKRPVELDLADRSGLDALHELLGRADVLIESWPVGGADRLGLGYDDLHRRYPSLVAASISSFGAVGRHRNLDAPESIVHAVIGTTGEQAGHRDPPIYEGLPFASIGAAYLAVIGILGSLYRRFDDGIGRRVETSMLDGALAYLSMMWGNHDGANPGAPMPGSYRLVTGTFLCSDDTYLAVHSGAVGAFGRLMAELGLDDKVKPSETGLDIGVPLTPAEKEVLDAELVPRFRARPRDEWLDRLRKADVCALPHLVPGRVFDEPQARHNAMVVTVDDPVLGPVEQVAPGVMVTAEAAELGPWLPAAPAGAPSAAASASAIERPLLDGVHIVDLGAYYAGPYSSRLLADLGADVIKVEPLGGDQVRGLERVFRSASAHKRSLAANLKDPALDDARRGLVEWAHMVHHNMRPGAAERLGMGYADCAAINPALVYLYAPGWGSTGPDSDRQSFAPMMSAYVGVSTDIAGQFNEPVHPIGNEDPGNGLLGAVAMLMGLLRQRRCGQGCYVENPQLNATMAHMAHVVRTVDGTVLGAGRLDTLQKGVSVYDRLYETADGWIAVGADTAERRADFERIVGVRVDGDATAASDAWFACEEAIAAKPSEHWIGELTRAGVPCVRPIATNNNDVVMADPEFRQLGRVAAIPHPTQGEVRQIGCLVRVSDTAPATPRYAPALGEHTDQILSDLGYDADIIAELRRRSSVR